MTSPAACSAMPKAEENRMRTWQAPFCRKSATYGETDWKDLTAAGKRLPALSR